MLSAAQRRGCVTHITQEAILRCPRGLGAGTGAGVGRRTHVNSGESHGMAKLGRRADLGNVPERRKCALARALGAVAAVNEGHKELFVALRQRCQYAHLRDLEALGGRAVSGTEDVLHEGETKDCSDPHGHSVGTVSAFRTVVKLVEFYS